MGRRDLKRKRSIAQFRTWDCYVVAIPLLLMMLHAKFTATVIDEGDVIDNKIADYYRSLGANFRGTVGKSCSSCIRGMISSHDVQPGEKILEIPINLVHFLNGEYDNDGKVPGFEVFAYNFAIDVFGNTVFNTTHKGWFDSMSRNCRGNIFLASKNDLRMLEMPRLEHEIVKKIKKLEAVYYGNKYENFQSNDALNYVIEPRVLSFEQFADIAYMSETRRMQLENKEALIPLFDYVNNAESSKRADLQFFNNGSHVGFAAIKHIKRGSEMRWSYKGAISITPDQIFSTWQYITEETSVLFQDDEDAFLRIFSNTNLSEVEKIRSFIAYIDGVLAQYSTSVREDEKLLLGGKLSSVQHALVGLRMHRKRILREKRTRMKQLELFNVAFSIFL